MTAPTGMHPARSLRTWALFALGAAVLVGLLVNPEATTTRITGLVGDTITGIADGLGLDEPTKTAPTIDSEPVDTSRYLGPSDQLPLLSEDDYEARANEVIPTPADVFARYGP